MPSPKTREIIETGQAADSLTRGPAERGVRRIQTRRIAADRYSRQVLFAGIGAEGQQKAGRLPRRHRRLRRHRGRGRQSARPRRRRHPHPDRSRFRRREQPPAPGALRRSRRARGPAQGRSRPAQDLSLQQLGPGPMPASPTWFPAISTNCCAAQTSSSTAPTTSRPAT